MNIKAYSSVPTVEPTLTRRRFVKLGGVLMVSFTFLRLSSPASEPPAALTGIA